MVNYLEDPMSALSIIKPGIKAQHLTIEWRYDYFFHFQNFEEGEVVTIEVRRSELVDQPEVWKLLCQLAEKFSVFSRPFYSEDSAEPDTAMNISRFEEKVVFDFSSVGKERFPMMIGVITFCTQGHSPENLTSLPIEIELDEFDHELKMILKEIVELDRRIVIHSGRQGV